MAYLDDSNGAHVDSLLSVVQAFQELFDVDVDTGEAICVGTEDEIADVMEYAARIVSDITDEDGGE